MTAKEKFLHRLGEIISQNTAFEDVVFGLLAEDGYVIPMALRYAVKYSNETIDHIPRYSSADHGTNLKTLCIVLKKCLARKRLGTDPAFYPYIDEPIVIDPLVEECFEYVRNLIFLQNIHASANAL